MGSALGAGSTASSLAPALCQPWPPLEEDPLSPEAHLGQDSNLANAPAGLGLLLESLGPGPPLEAFPYILIWKVAESLGYALAPVAAENVDVHMSMLRGN